MNGWDPVVWGRVPYWQDKEQYEICILHKKLKYLKSWAFVFTFDSTVSNIANFFLMLWKCFVSKNCIKIKTSDLAHVDSGRRKYIKILCLLWQTMFYPTSVILTFSLDGRDSVNGFHTVIVINRNIYRDWISQCGGRV